MIAIGAVVAVTLGAIGLGIWGVRLARTTSDLYVASRAITPWWNAAAISGEYLSAASFLGVAGLRMKIGASALWLPVGFAAGYLALLFFVAAPLRRFGSYTIPDFAEARLRSPALRTVAALVVLAIGGFYLVPQLKGAGLTLESVAGTPYWFGVAAVGAIVALTVAFGGMRGVTYVQAYQYWVKTFGIALPACLLLVHLGGLPARSALFGQELPRAPGGGLTVELDSSREVEFPERTAYEVNGRPAESAAGEDVRLPAGTIVIPGGAAVPVATDGEAQSGADWSRPVERGDGSASPVFVYSLLIATFLGTMGLPHILVRFYTNPDGRAARGTTVRVLGLLGLFYLFPPIYGALGRVLTPQLYLTGETDAVVLELPEAAWPGLGGEILAALTAAGAFAAFMSTASGLLVSISGTISYDLRLPGRRAQPERAAPERRMRMFRNAAFAGMLVPAVVALGARGQDISVLVGWAFALAASTFCPMLLLGIWWRGLTARGAIAGILAGGLVASVGIVVTLAAGTQDGVPGALLAQPAVVSVPIAFATMAGVSIRDRRRPVDVDAQMLALHAPEELELEPARA
jgi:cation/acetate symporter